MDDDFTMARTTVSTPLKPDPSKKMISTNNVERMPKVSLVTPCTQSYSELIAEWDHNGWVFYIRLE